MKPTRNKVFCRDCEWSEVLLETKRKAVNAIRFKGDEFEAEFCLLSRRALQCEEVNQRCNRRQARCRCYEVEEVKETQTLKPSKSKVYCADCGRSKMLFQTEKKAANFIRFNAEVIEAESGFCPQRTYFCMFCCGWHVTSKLVPSGISLMEKHLGRYFKEKEAKSAPKSVVQAVPQKAIAPRIPTIRRKPAPPKEPQAPNFEELRAQRIQVLEDQVSAMEEAQKEKFFIEKILLLNAEIAALSEATRMDARRNLKELRHDLQNLHTVKNLHGFRYLNSRHEAVKEINREGWRVWAAKSGYAIP